MTRWTEPSFRSVLLHGNVVVKLGLLLQAQSMQLQPCMPTSSTQQHVEVVPRSFCWFRDALAPTASCQERLDDIIPQEQSVSTSSAAARQLTLERFKQIERLDHQRSPDQGEVGLLISKTIPNHVSRAA